MVTFALYLAILITLSKSAKELTGWDFKIDLQSADTGYQVAGYDFITNRAWLLGGNSNNDLFSYDISSPH